MAFTCVVVTSTEQGKAFTDTPFCGAVEAFFREGDSLSLQCVIERPSSPDFFMFLGGIPRHMGDMPRENGENAMSAPQNPLFSRACMSKMLMALILH
jgi:hypothetical protein